MTARSTYRRPDQALLGTYAVCEEAEYASAANVAPPCDLTDPSVSLLLAVLERAILDLGGKGNDEGYGRRATAVNQREAFDWIASDDETHWSFGWVCDHLALSRSLTRASVFALAQRLKWFPSLPHGDWYDERRATRLSAQKAG